MIFSLDGLIVAALLVIVGWSCWTMGTEYGRDHHYHQGWDDGYRYARQTESEPRA